MIWCISLTLSLSLSLDPGRVLSRIALSRRRGVIQAPGEPGVHVLEEVLRQRDSTFVTILNEVRVGSLSAETARARRRRPTTGRVLELKLGFSSRFETRVGIEGLDDVFDR